MTKIFHPDPISWSASYIIPKLSVWRLKRPIEIEILKMHKNILKFYHKKIKLNLFSKLQYFF